MLIFLIDSKTQECVKEVFDYLTKTLGAKNFRKLFPLILNDRGSEFQAPKELEYMLVVRNELASIIVINNVHGKSER